MPAVSSRIATYAAKKSAKTETDRSVSPVRRRRHSVRVAIVEAAGGTTASQRGAPPRRARSPIRQGSNASALRVPRRRVESQRDGGSYDVGASRFARDVSARSEISKKRPSRAARERPLVRAEKPCASSCRCTARRGCITIFGSKPTECSPRGRSRKDRRSLPATAAWRCTSRTIRSTTAISRGTFPRAIRRRQRHRLGRGNVRARRRRRSRRRDRERKNQVRAARQEAARRLHARQDQAARARERRPVAAHQRSRRTRRSEVRSGRPSRIGEERKDARRRCARSAREEPGSRSRKRASARPRPGARERQTRPGSASEVADARDARRRTLRRSAIGSSRSSGTAIARSARSTRRTRSRSCRATVSICCGAFRNWTACRRASRALPVVVDGEIVSLDAKGRSEFQRLQESQKETGRPHLCRVRSALRRRPRSAHEAARGAQGAARTADSRRRTRALLQTHRRRRQGALRERARSSDSKASSARSATSTYQERRSRDWVKIKTGHEQEFVVGGWTEPKGSRKGFGALLLGVYREAARCATSARSGRVHREDAARALTHGCADRTQDVAVRQCRSTRTRRRTGFRPNSSSQVRFSEWTRDGYLRQPAYLGLRPTNPPRTSSAELPVDGLMAEQRVPVRVGSRTLFAFESRQGAVAARRLHEGRSHRVLRSVAPFAIAHLKGRPLTLQRYPNGIDGQAFFEKQMPRGVPDWVDARHRFRRGAVRAATLRLRSATTRRASSISRTWRRSCCTSGRRDVPALDEPDFVIFDLDPGEKCTLKTLATVALGVRDLLAQIGLKALVKTTGGYGVHVVVPLAIGILVRHRESLRRDRRAPRRERTRRARTLQRTIAKRPHERRLPRLRAGRSRQDDRRPVFGARSRRRAGLDAAALGGDRSPSRAGDGPAAPADEFAKFTIATTPKRLEREGDLWGRKCWKKQRLEAAIDRAQPLVVGAGPWVE